MKNSALVYFERYLTETAWFRINADARAKPAILRRLGKLCEKRGDSERAPQHYADVVDLYANADSELQPIVEDVREPIARLAGWRR